MTYTHQVSQPTQVPHSLPDPARRLRSNPPRRILVTPSTYATCRQSIQTGKGPITIDIEASGLDAFAPDFRLAGIGVHDPSSNATFYFPFGHALSQNLSQDRIQDLVDSLNQREHIYHNAKYDFKGLRRFSTGLRDPDHDTYFERKSIDFNQPAGLKAMGAEYGLGTQIEIEELVDFNAGQTFNDVPTSHPKLLPYVSADTENTWVAHQIEHAILFQAKPYQIYRLEMMCTPETVKMEENGFLVSDQILEKIGEEYAALRAQTQQEVWDLFRRLLEEQQGISLADNPTRDWEFPLHSSARLAGMLYDRLGIPTDGVRQGKKNFSTDADTLQILATRPGLEWIHKILDYKEAIKGEGMVKTYRAAIKPDGRIHCDLRQVWVISGRYACAEPNLQQVPKSRRGQGSKITGFRRAFIAPEGWYLLSCDFSQIEYRIFAAMAGAKALINAFNSGLDPHRTTASISSGLPYDAVSAEQRDAAKTTGFGLIYGQTARGLAIKLRITEAAAERIHSSFFAAIPEFKRFVHTTQSFCRKNGGVFTQYGRWIPIPEIHSSNRYDRQKAERLAVNSTIQGTAADVLKMAILKVAKAIKKSGHEGLIKPILTVHDELDFEVHNSIPPQVSGQLILDAMETEFGPLKLTCEAEYGPNWYDLEPVFPKAPKPKQEEKATADITLLVPKLESAGLRSDILELLFELQLDPDDTSPSLSVAMKGPNGEAIIPSRISADFLRYLRRLDPTNTMFVTKL